MNLLTTNDTPGQYPDSYYASVVAPLPPFEAAAGTLKCDVCVIGGGFTGLSSALHLAEKGYDVILLEAQRVGFGASGRNGGQVGVGQRVDQDTLEEDLGKTLARTLWDISLDSVQLVRELAQTPEVDCPFHDGIIHADHRQLYVKDSFAYAEKLQTEYDHHSIRALDQAEIQQLVGSSAYYGGTLDTASGHINPLGLALGLARLAAKKGVRIFERATVTELVEGAPALVKTDQAEIKANYVLLACNGYLGDLQPKVASHVMPINNYVVATEPMSPDQQESLIRHNHAVADSKFVINYFRFSDDHRLLFGGTESYGYRFPSDIASAVRKPMLEIYPQLKDIRIDYAWGGTLAITLNRMPHFERLRGNILSMSGYSGHGVAMATYAGKMLADALSGQAEQFDAMARVPTPKFPGGSALRSPLLVLAMLWYSLRDKF